MSIFFTSDTHFGAQRTLELSRRPFQNTAEMDKTIIKNWNKKVGKDDVVYHLGDFGDKTNIAKLNGNVILILGNYEEKEIENDFSGDFETFKQYLKSLGFYDVIEKNIIIELNDEKIFLTHKPLDCKKDMFNLFGHIHGAQKQKKFGLDVGTDGNFFTPYSVEDILFWKNAIEIHKKGKSVFCDIEDLQF
ncbi:MAG TPA: hypothetical protein DCO89_01515 [Clostridiales bacterium]|nr:hypothetical protein [Clostridiales bacterium]